MLLTTKKIHYSLISINEKDIEDDQYIDFIELLENAGYGDCIIRDKDGFPEKFNLDIDAHYTIEYGDSGNFYEPPSYTHIDEATFSIYDKEIKKDILIDRYLFSFDDLVERLEKEELSI